jgi:ribosomal protein S6
LKTYDALFVFPSQLKEETVDAAVERIRKEVARQGGEVAGARFQGRRNFARPLKKREAGVYVRMGLMLEPAHVAPLRARLKLVEDLFRVLITECEPDRMISGDAAPQDAAPPAAPPAAAPAATPAAAPAATPAAAPAAVPTGA